MFRKVTPSPARAYDSPPALTSPQRLEVTHLQFPCQRRAPPLFKLSLFLQYLGKRSKSVPRFYEFFCLKSHILSFPKVLQIPPESPCTSTAGQYIGLHYEDQFSTVKYWAWDIWEDQLLRPPYSLVFSEKFPSFQLFWLHAFTLSHCCFFYVWNGLGNRRWPLDCVAQEVV